MLPSTGQLHYIDGMSNWPTEPPGMGMSVGFTGDGGEYNIRAVDGIFLVRWPSGLGSDIRQTADGFQLVITDGKNSEVLKGLTWAEVGERHP